MNAKTEFLFNIGDNKVKCAYIYDELKKYNPHDDAEP